MEDPLNLPQVILFKKKITLTHTSTQHSENLLYLCWSKFMNHA